jgi:succinate-acetate transporter protein
MSTSQKPHFEHHESVLNESVKEVGNGNLHHEEVAAPMTMPIPPFYNSKVAAIGFASFATGALMMGLYCIGLLTNLPQVVVGVALGYTGICQFASGLMEMVQGNTFAATTMMVRPSTDL